MHYGQELNLQTQLIQLNVVVIYMYLLSVDDLTSV